MKKSALVLAITAAAFSAPSFATNGDVLIGLGAQARALGGTGTAAFFGSENALTNPALLGKMQGTEFSIGGTVFMPDVNASTNVASMDGSQVSQTSDNDLNIIPEVSLATRINDNLTFGLGIFGSAGMGVDYQDNANYQDGMGLFNGYSNLQLMKLAPSLSYNEANFGIGFAPVIQYGALDINYKKFATDGNPATSDSPTLSNVGNGMASDLGYGFNLGGYFDITPEFTVALAYQSAISMEYDGQITGAADGFGIGPNGLNTISSDKLEQPAEIKIGAAYTMGNWLMTADYKQIKWSDAEGYKDFNWEDQDVFGIGAKYSGNGYWVGAGYNYAEDPIKVIDNANVTDPNQAFANSAINLFNNHFFPGIVESHFTFGGGYNITKNSAIDLAVVYADEVTKTIDTTAVSAGLSEGANTNPTSHTTTHSQLGYTISYRMNF